GIVVSGGTVSGLGGGGSSYTFVLVPASSSCTMTVGISAGAARDGAGNGNLGSNVLTILEDAIPPTVTLLSSATSTSTVVTVMFSEPVTGFSDADIAGTGAISALTGNGTTYSFNVAPFIALAISVPAGAAQDAAGNPSLGSNVLLVVAEVIGVQDAIDFAP